MESIPKVTHLEMLALGALLKKKDLPIYQLIHDLWGDSVRVNWPGQHVTFMFNQKDIQEVLVSKANHFHKEDGYKYLRGLLGNGLLLSEDQVWKKNRKLMNKSFSKSMMMNFYRDEICELTDQVLNSLSSGELYIDDIFSDLTLKIIIKIFLGVEVPDLNIIKNAMNLELERSDIKMKSLFGIPDFLPTKKNLKTNHALRKFDQLVLGILEDKKSDNLLTQFKSELINDEISKQEIVDEIKTLLLAGHETTSNLLTWSLYHLSQNLEVLSKYKEDFDEEYLEAILKESMRLSPPIPVIARQCIKDVCIGNKEIKSGDKIALTQFVTHKDKRYWEKSSQFYPERFLNIKKVNSSGIRYFPFGAGMRMCIGDKFAMMEAKIILQTFLTQFDYEILDFINESHHFVLKPEKGLRVNLKKQSESLVKLRF